MPLDYLLKGLTIGFSLAAPIGPVGILCARGTMIHGARRGIIIGLSGACGDVVYAFAAAFGVKLVFDLVLTHEEWMRLLGGIVLICAGIYTYRSRSSPNAMPKPRIQETGIFVSTFLLDLTNPLTLFGFAAAFSAIGVNKITGDRVSMMLLIGGVFLGSSLWFSLLVWFTRIFKEKVTTRGVSIINKVVGVLLIVIGCAGVFYGLRGLIKD